MEFYASTSGQPIDVDALMAAHPFIASQTAPLSKPESEIRRLARALAATAPKRNQAFNPMVLPSWVIETLNGFEPSGRFFRALQQHAKYCLRNGYAIEPEELFDAVYGYYRSSTKAKPRPNGIAEATHALDYASKNITTHDQSRLDGFKAALAARFS